MTFAVEALGFLHGTIHGPSFLQKHRRFIEEKDSQGILFMGTAWLSFYFSQLTLALHHLPPLTTDAWGICGKRSLIPVPSCTVPELCHAYYDSYRPQITGTTLVQYITSIVMVLRFHGIPGYYVPPYNLRPVMRVLRLWVSSTLDKAL